MSLHINIDTPSTELSNSPIDKVITFLAAHAALERRNGGLPEAPLLDITFMLPGKDAVPVFNGTRMGSCSDDRRSLFFEIAVPSRIVHSSDAPQYVALVLEDMVEYAGRFFRASNVLFDERQWRSALTRLTGLDAGIGNVH